MSPCRFSGGANSSIDFCCSRATFASGPPHSPSLSRNPMGSPFTAPRPCARRLCRASARRRRPRAPRASRGPGRRAARRTGLPAAPPSRRPSSPAGRARAAAASRPSASPGASSTWPAPPTAALLLGEQAAEQGGGGLGMVPARPAAEAAALESGKPAPAFGLLLPGARLPRFLFVESRLGGQRPDLVVEGALLRVPQRREGVGDFLEALLRLLVALVHVRVELLGQLAVGLLDLLRGGGLGDAEDGVGVFHRARDRNHAHQTGQPAVDPCAGRSLPSVRERNDGRRSARSLRFLGARRGTPAGRRGGGGGRGPPHHALGAGRGDARAAGA